MNTVWLAIFGVVFVWSAIAPKDYFTWFLEVLPAVIALVLLWWTRHRFPFTPLGYTLVLIHCVILMVGGHYTYAEVPLFDWIKDAFDLGRNHYDKVGHFAQGFVPAVVAREIIVRQQVISTEAWRNFFIVCVCLAISAFYELIEWWVAELSGDSAEAFLGTQGYVWDTQSDMAMALVGSIGALVTLRAVHDRQLAQIARVRG